MSELPGRPNIDQLRRQARELLRAAADGEPAALARVRAFSERVSLSAAQLAVAREYGFASWPALHAEVERRLAELPPGEGEAGRAETGWSFGGGSPIETVAGRDTETTLTKQGEQLDKTLKAQSEQLDRTLAEQRTRTLNERFDTVAEQLGSDKPPAVRLAAVYAMAGLADDWQDHRQMCVDVLCAYLRMPYEPGPGDDAPAEKRLAFQASREVRHTVIRVITAHLNGTGLDDAQAVGLAVGSLLHRGIHRADHPPRVDRQSVGNLDRRCAAATASPATPLERGSKTRRLQPARHAGPAARNGRP